MSNLWKVTSRDIIFLYTQHRSVFPRQHREAAAYFKLEAQIKLHWNRSSGDGAGVEIDSWTKDK